MKLIDVTTYAVKRPQVIQHMHNHHVDTGDISKITSRIVKEDGNFFTTTSF